MENFFVRYKNPLALMAVLFIQVVGLATQVKRPENARAGNTGSGTRLIRVWTVTAFTPVEKMFVSTGHFFRNGWQNYADLRSVRKQNRDLQEQVARLQMEQVQLRQDADQARRLQTLLDFKEKFVARTVAAQVIGTSGTEQSRVIIIDKGSRDGLKPDMAVITPDGIVGKVKDVFPMSSQVLLINDHDSGAGVILEHSRLQGILKGTPLGELQINDIMSDEKVDAGEHLITSGGDRIYPKGFSVGMVISATPDRDNDPFQVIKIKPSADLGRLEEVIVITKMTDDSQAAAATPVPMRAADILAQRLPSVPKVDPKAAKTPGGTSGATVGGPTPTPVKNKPTGEAEQKPGTGNVSKSAVPTDSAATTPAGTAKSGGEGKKPVTPAQAGTGSATATATPALPKPKPTPRKPKPPTTGTDGATPSASHAPSDQPAAAQPTATPTPATDQEKPPR